MTENLTDKNKEFLSNITDIQKGIYSDKYKELFRQSWGMSIEEFQSMNSKSVEIKQYRKEDYIPTFHSLQPKNFEEYVGQEHIKEILNLEIQGCSRKNIPLRHILLYGGAGLGKTSLSKIIAKEADKPFFEITSSGLDNIEKLLDLIEKINTINISGSILFLDEIHCLKREIQTHLYSLMTDNKITITKEKQVECIDVVPLTIIGATTYAGELDSAFKSRFSLPLKLCDYSTKEMKTILKNAIRRLEYEVEDDALNLLALSCRNSPRVANNLIVSASRLTDHCITKYDVEKIFRMIKIYPDGLEIPHIRLLHALFTSEKGNLGLNTLAKKSGEDVASISEDWENYLISENYIEIQTRGRMITEKGRKYITDIMNNETYRKELEYIIK